MGRTGTFSYIRSFVIYELFIKVAGLSFGFPIVRGALSLAIRAAGYSYLTKGNLRAVVLSPLSVGFLIVFVLVLSLIFLHEMCVISLMLRMKRTGLSVSFFAFFFGGIGRMMELFRSKWRGIFSAVLSFLFVVLINFPVWLFLFLGLRQTESIVRGLMKPNELLLLILLSLLLWWFALFGCLTILFPGLARPSLENKRDGRLIPTIRAALRRKYGKILRGLLFRSILLFLLEAALYVLGLAIYLKILHEVMPETILAVFVMRTYSRYHFLACILFASVNAVIFEYFIASSAATVPSEGVREEDSDQRYALTEAEIAYGSILSGRRGRKRLIVLVSSFLVVLFVSVLGTLSFFKNIHVIFAEALDVLCITAHRGASEDAPENTLSAVEMAIRQLADYAEIDVQLSKDGVVVLHHDETLRRSAGISSSVHALTAEELSMVDVGSSFSAEFEGEGVPTLEEVFDRFGGRIGFNIDMKAYHDDSAYYENDLATGVVSLIEKYQLEESCVVTSTSASLLSHVKEQNENIKTGRILSLVYGDVFRSEETDFISVYHGFVTEKLVELIHAEGKEIHVWTVNSESEIKHMKTIGVDNIITDRPMKAREAMYDEKVAGTVAEWLKLLLP